jgi:hypothetical protein
MARAIMTAMTTGNCRWLALIVLIAWVTLGPVGMAFESCAAMMSLCDGGPCGVVSALVDAPVFSAPAMSSTTVTARAEQATTVQPSTIEPPPKHAPLFA